MKYNDIIKLRGGKAAYNIKEEKATEWTSFIPNEQFNNVLRTVLRSVRNNDIDVHKSFWINGTYGTGKSHAAAVVGHLLGDDVNDIREWVDYEYADPKFMGIRNDIYTLRANRRLLVVKLYGLAAMTHPLDLALVVQQAVESTLRQRGIDLCVPTDFERYIAHIEQNRKMWEDFIGSYTELSSIVADTDQLIDHLKDKDLGTFHRISDTLRKVGINIRLNNEDVTQWLVEVQDKLTAMGTYNGLLIVWDEFTDVMTNPIGLAVLKKLQEVAEKFANQENNSYIFLISHPSAFDKFNSDQLKQTDGRYHRMKYNMEPVSAFKIMSRKFEVVDKTYYENIRQLFYIKNDRLLDIYTATSNDPEATKEDLRSLYPLHPGTANLSTHYATVVGSSSRSVFEFLGQNEAIKTFLDSEEAFLNREVITADYLWDYVLAVFQDDVANYGPVTERYNSYRLQVANQGEAYLAIFKSILLLNAFNNVSGENNNGLITPSRDNITALYAGTKYEGVVDTVLTWFNDQAIIQRAPGDLFSVQFTALPANEIEEKKTLMRNVEYNTMSKVLYFTDAAAGIFEKKFMQKIIRPYAYKFYSDVQNDSSLRSQIKNGRRDVENCTLFFALLMARNNQELAKLHSFAEACATDEEDPGLKNIAYVVFDEVMTDGRYEQFIEYQAHYACANSHGFADQQKVHRDHAEGMVKDWMEAILRNNATIYINGQEKMPLAVRHLSSVVNGDVAPMIYPYGPDACEFLRQKAPSTFWKRQNSKEIVRIFLHATSKQELQTITAQMRPVQYLIQDCLDDNMQWKDDVPEEHPFKKVFDKINNTIKYANKSVPFNLDEKLSDLTKPPYGLYGCFGAMAMVAFAFRGWEGKIFDMQGKPRDKNALIDDIVYLFKVWDDRKSNSKLTFKFQTPEEGKLCKAFTSLFKLNSKDNTYSDVSSLKDARYAITVEFLGKKETPLWAIKYAPESVFDKLPIDVEIDDEIKALTDDIVEICTEREVRNPALVNETLTLIEDRRIDMKNILNVEEAFTEGMKNFLMQIDTIDVKEDEIDEVKEYVKQNLQSTVGYWTEEEVVQKAKDWRLKQRMVTPPPTPPVVPTPQPTPPVDPDVIEEKRERALERIEEIDSLNEAIDLLKQLCDKGDEWLLDMINAI